MKKLTLAGCIILNDEGELLLLHRNTPTLVQWETPGGKVDDSESPEDAAAREVHEELGVRVRIIRQLGICDFIEREYTMTYVWYLAVITEGSPRPVESHKYDAVSYHSWAALETMAGELSPNTLNLLQAYKSQALDLENEAEFALPGV